MWKKPKKAYTKSTLLTAYEKINFSYALGSVDLVYTCIKP